MTFARFCDKEFLDATSRNQFKDWLGERAKGHRMYSEWWKLFLAFMRRN